MRVEVYLPPRAEWFVIARDLTASRAAELIADAVAAGNARDRYRASDDGPPAVVKAAAEAAPAEPGRRQGRLL